MAEAAVVAEAGTEIEKTGAETAMDVVEAETAMDAAIVTPAMTATETDVVEDAEVPTKAAVEAEIRALVATTANRGQSQSGCAHAECTATRCSTAFPKCSDRSLASFSKTAFQGCAPWLKHKTSKRRRRGNSRFHRRSSKLLERTSFHGCEAQSGETTPMLPSRALLRSTCATFAKSSSPPTTERKTMKVAHSHNS